MLDVRERSKGLLQVRESPVSCSPQEQSFSTDEMIKGLIQVTGAEN